MEIPPPAVRSICAGGPDEKIWIPGTAPWPMVNAAKSICPLPADIVTLCVQSPPAAAVVPEYAYTPQKSTLDNTPHQCKRIVDVFGRGSGNAGFAG
jgi:hypothetical protein